MVRTAEQTARAAERSGTNDPGYCLKWSRQQADIGPLYPDAATAWRHARDRHQGDRNPPRGAMVYWLGGSNGYGHIAVSLGDGRVRSTDAGGAGRVATVGVGWIGARWGLPYAGWADNVNGVEIPGVGAEMTEDEWVRMRQLVRAEVDRVWSGKMTMTQPGTGQDVKKARQQVLRELWQKVTKAT